MGKNEVKDNSTVPNTNLTKEESKNESLLFVVQGSDQSINFKDWVTDKRSSYDLTQNVRDMYSCKSGNGTVGSKKLPIISKANNEEY